MKKISFTVSSFKRMIEDQNYYVDKSMFISHVIRDEVSLYTRPRRFGKSMNMSMLYYFFSIKEKDNARLFDHLKITDAKESFYHGFLAGLLHNDRYELKSNQEAGKGRFDLALIPRLPFGTGIIIECKYSRKESDLFTMCDEACAQIVSKEYALAFAREYKMLAYGIAFAKKKAYIKEVHNDLE